MSSLHSGSIMINRKRRSGGRFAAAPGLTQIFADFSLFKSFVKLSRFSHADDFAIGKIRGIKRYPADYCRQEKSVAICVCHSVFPLICVDYQFFYDFVRLSLSKTISANFRPQSADFAAGKIISVPQPKQTSIATARKKSAPIRAYHRRCRRQPRSASELNLK